MEKKRYEMLDAYRGFTLLSMIGYHLSYDVFVLYSRYPGWLSDMRGYIWQQSICISFIFLSGICASFGRNHWKRGLMLNLCGLIITAVTVIFSPSAAVYFGVLNLLGCAQLLIIPLKKIVNENNWSRIAGGSIFLFLLFRHITKGYIGIGEWIIAKIPEIFYQCKILTPFGFPYAGFRSADYFPVLPWFFLFFAGYACSYLLKKSQKISTFLMPKVPVLSWLGKHSLIVYMIHQPVLMVICMLLF